MDIEPADDSIVVELVTWTLYTGWLSVLAGAGVYFELPPLINVQKAFAVPWQGTIAAVVTGVVILMAARWLATWVQTGGKAKESPE